MSEQLTNGRIGAKALFEAGDRPTDANFRGLFDSILFLGETNPNSNGLTTISDSFYISGSGDVTNNLFAHQRIMIGKPSDAAPSLTRPLQVYNDETNPTYSDPIVYISSSQSDIMIEGISADATSSIKLTDNTSNIRFGTHTGGTFLEVGGNEVIYVDSTTKTYISGSVGIGTRTPNQPLHIYRDANSDTYVRIETDKTDGYAQILYQNDAQQWNVGINNANNFVVRDDDNSKTPLTIEPNASSNTLVIDANGRVGIGTDSPATILDVRGDLVIGATPVIRFYDDNNVASKPDIQFSNSALISAEENLLFAIDSDNSGTSAKFEIIHNTPSASGTFTSLFKVSENGQVSASQGFVGDGSQLTGITTFTGFAAGALNENNMVTLNAAGDGLIGEDNIKFDGSKLIVSGNIELDNTYDIRMTGSIFIGPAGDVRFDEGFHMGYEAGGLNFAETTVSDYRLFLKDGGNVGIGTSNPTEKLTVAGRISASGQIEIGNNGSEEGGEIKLIGGDDFDAHFYLDVWQKNYRVHTGGTTRFIVSSSGNVGINTTSPEARFDVKTGTTSNDMNIMFREEGANQQAIIFKENDTEYFSIHHDGDAGVSPNNLLKIRSANGSDSNIDVDAITIKQNGNVGIGTNSPANKLEVGGIVSSSDSFQVKGGGTGVTLGANDLQFDRNQVSYISNVNSGGNSKLALTAGGGSGNVVMTISGSTFVGIGTQQPKERLEIIGNLSASGTGSFGFLQADSLDLAGADFTDDITFGEGKGIRWSYATDTAHLLFSSSGDSGPTYLEMGTTDNNTEYISFTMQNYTDTTYEKLRIGTQGLSIPGNPNFGVQGQLTIGAYSEVDAGSDAYGAGARPALHIKSNYQGTSYGLDGQAGGGLRLSDNDTSHYWDISFINNALNFSSYIGLAGAQTASLQALMVADQEETTEEFVTEQLTAFTGQHPCRPSVGTSNDYDGKIGYIVIADGTYDNAFMSNGVTNKTSANINEALPKVKLSDQQKDKRVFGVISNAEDDNIEARNLVRGNFVSFKKIKNGDSARVWINSVGEGGIWVTNYNGSLENGDYVTTSPIEGLGMKQDDDILHNYTVAKLTQDCNFTGEAVDFTHNGQSYKKQFVGCTYHCG